MASEIELIGMIDLHGVIVGVGMGDFLCMSKRHIKLLAKVA